LSHRIDQYLRTSHVNGIIFDGEDIARKRPAMDDLNQPPKKLKPEQNEVSIDPTIAYAFIFDSTNPLALYDAQSIPLSYAVESVIRSLQLVTTEFLENTLNVPPLSPSQI
jgi:hypothetical protein